MTPCPRGDAVARAARTRNWPEDLHAHLPACEDCRDIALVAGVLVAQARDVTADPPPLADASVLWRRAQRTLRERQVQRATAVITWTQRTALAALCAVAFFAASGTGAWGPVRHAVIDWPSAQFAEIPFTVSAGVVAAGAILALLAIGALCGELVDRRTRVR